jgi:hypothetical protein
MLIVIRQNLIWAFLYNLFALPLAIMGHVAPRGRRAGKIPNKNYANLCLPWLLISAKERPGAFAPGLGFGLVRRQTLL